MEPSEDIRRVVVAQTGEFEFEPAREVELKGVEGVQHVYPLAAGG